MFVSYTGAVNGIQEVWTNRQTIGGNLLLNALGLGPGFVSLVPMALMKIMLMSSAMMIRHLHKSQTALLFLWRSWREFLMRKERTSFVTRSWSLQRTGSTCKLWRLIPASFFATSTSPWTLSVGSMTMERPSALTREKRPRLSPTTSTAGFLQLLPQEDQHHPQLHHQQKSPKHICKHWINNHLYQNLDLHCQLMKG